MPHTKYIFSSQAIFGLSMLLVIIKSSWVHLQGSQRVWKTGKKIMVREKSGNSQGILFWAKSQGKVWEFLYFSPRARVFFSRMV